MAKRKIEYYKDLEGNKKAEIEIHYQLGGMNYFSSKTEPRGYYVGFNTVEITDHNGYKSKSFTLWGPKSFKIMAKTVNRQSKAALNDVVNKIEQIKDKLFELYLQDNKHELFQLIHPSA